MQAACGCLAGERPVRDAVVRVRAAPHSRIGRLGRAQQFVGADRQRLGQAGKVVEGESALTGLETAQRRHVDARAACHVLQRQTALNAQITQATANPQVDVVLGRVVCLHGKLDWQIERLAASWRHG